MRRILKSLWVVLLVLHCNFLTALGNYLKTLKGTQFTTSVIIPVCAQHAQHLYPLLKLLEQQTELPDEVVISLSESGNVQPAIFDELQDELWLFPVRLLVSKKKQFAGKNRNIACAHATGDLFICQDADDIPHRQRVEIINYFFETYAVSHLIHQFAQVSETDSVSFPYHLNLRQIKFHHPENHFNIWYYCSRFTNGNVAITKYLFDQLKWSETLARGQDTKFNKDVYARFRQRIAIHVELLGYRQFLSSSGEPSAQDVEYVLPLVDEAEEEDELLYELTLVRLD